MSTGGITNYFNSSDYGNMSFGNTSNSDLDSALQGISQAIGNSAEIYQEATNQVSNIAQQVATTNINYLQTTGTQSQAVLAPFQAAGAQSQTQLNNLMGVNGTAAQQSALSSIMSSANGVNSSNMNILNQLFGGSTVSAAAQATGNPQIQQAAQTSTQAQANAAAQQFAGTNPAAQQVINSFGTNSTAATNIMNGLAQGMSPAQIMQTYGNQSGMSSQLISQVQQAVAQNPTLSTQLSQTAGALTGGTAQASSSAMQQYQTYVNDGVSPTQAMAQSGVTAAQVAAAQAPQPQQATAQPATTSTTGANYAGNMLQQLTGTSNAGQYASNLINGLTSGANSAVNNFTNNAVVQNSMNALDQYGQQSVQNSAAANGMLNSGNTLMNLYNMGSGLAGQYLVPQISATANNVLDQGITSANNFVSSGVGADTSLANSLIGANTTASDTALTNASSALGQSAALGQNAATTQAGVLSNLGSSVAQQNTNTANTQSNAILSNANAQSNALLQNAQLQYLTQSLTPASSGGGLGQAAGAIGGGIASQGLLAGVGAMFGI